VSRPFKGKMIAIQKVEQTCSVLVRGFPDAQNHQYVELYFERHTRAEVTNVQIRDDHIIVTFASCEGDATIKICKCNHK